VEVISDVGEMEKINKGYFEKNALFLCEVLPLVNVMKERKPKLLYERKN
tara:strand:+ start:2355 stop:2501 length:147 start_codon:yes stop_codon:yes gene_type:complete